MTSVNFHLRKKSWIHKLNSILSLKASSIVDRVVGVGVLHFESLAIGASDEISLINVQILFPVMSQLW